MPRPLPVDAVLPAVIDAARAGNVIVTAPPGSGKTTRVPPALDGRVVVVEPRRLATRMAAGWVAEERGGQVGGEVGYQVRFESRCGPQTRVTFVTEGVLVRRLVDDPELRCVDFVVLDEFHERHLQADVALALLRRLQLGPRPDLRLIAMSATLDAAPLAAALGDCPVIAAEGRMYPVEIEYDDPGDRPLEGRVAAAVRRALDAGSRGDLLVFLPGAPEIRRVLASCAGLAELHEVDLVPLHGDLPLEAQRAAVQPGPRRRVILSTNVAESSVTVEGVTVVIDSGLARVASTSPWSGLDEVRTEKISRASADQRAGRAGRVRPGRCVRLYARHDYERRVAHDLAEVHRVDLSETVLLLHGLGVGDVASLPWFEVPSPAALEQAEGVLARLGAVDRGALTAVGRQMLALPLHPRLARLVVEAERRGVADLGCLAAALLSERDIRDEARVRLGGGERTRAVHAGPSDVLAMIDAYRRRSGIDEAGARRVAAVERQLRRAVKGGPGRGSEGEDGLLKAVLVAWPDRVARRRGRDRASELLLCGGGTAKLAEGSVVREGDWLVTIDAEVRSGAPLVRVASEVEVDWLLDMFLEQVNEIEERVWNEKTGRVERVRRIMYERLVLDESRGAAPPDDASAAMLADAVTKIGAGAFADEDVVTAFLNRVKFVAGAMPEAGLAPLGEADVADTLRGLCAGSTSLSEVRAAAQGGGFMEALQTRLPPAARRLLERAAPTHVALSARRRVAVHYEPDRPPWIASRMQDFFGLREGPRVGEGRVPLVLHLLAPNQRPVQVTTDLAGFWVRTWPQVRKELSRRYPRHAWPEDPLSG